MKTTIKKVNLYTREISIVIPWEDLEAAFEIHIRRFIQKIKLPGFRKGKVPRKILIQKFGPEIEAEFSQNSIEIHYAEALQVHKIIPVNRAVIEDLNFSEGSSLNFKATLEIEPEIKLPKYKRKMKVKKNNYVPDENDIDSYIEEFRRQFAELKTIETESNENHILLVDMQELDHSGIPIIGKKIEDRYLKIGDGVFGGENLKNLTGLKIQDTAIIEIQGNKDKNPTRYQVNVKNIQEEILPELNDEFIKKLDSGAKDIISFRKNISKLIQERLDKEADGQLNEEIVEYFIQSTKLEPPPSMVDNMIDNAVEQAKSNNGETFDEEDYRLKSRPSVLRSVKWYLIRKELIKEEGLTVSEEHIADQIEKILASSKDEQGQIRRFYKKPANKERLREDLLDDVLYKRLKEHAKLTEVTVATADLRKQQELAMGGV
ncbi:MAG: trigger factor [Candidatus Neomarinimicrobiota bacterium]